jgi:nitroreductase
MTTLANDADVHELLQKRYSGRAYDAAREVTQADLDALLEAARWAPSSFNGQPWRFVLGRKGDATYEKLLPLLMGFNQAWAQHAPVLLLTAYETIAVRPDGQKMPNRTAQHDLGMANVSIALEAVNRGLMAHMMGGFNQDAARALINAEANGLELGPMMTIGYPGDPAHLGEEIQKREAAPRTRKPVEELLLTL